MLSRLLLLALQSLSLLLTTSDAFNIGINVHSSKRLLQLKRTNHVSAIQVLLHLSSLSNDEGDDVDDELKADMSPTSASLNPTQFEPLYATSPPPPTPMQLDPLFLAVTKMDPQTQNAERISLPIWGELILDRSLFVFLPIALFALGGIFLSFYVLINSSDTFVNAIIDTSMKQSIPTSSSSLPDSDSCRGLCSSQAQDLEGLSSYMNRLGRK
jgi:hypothetical protein